VLGLARLAGDETVADVGCGNGIYLAGLASRGHSGPTIGVDLSPGMLAAAQRGAPAAGLTVGDAAALPVASYAASMRAADTVPDPAAFVAAVSGRVPFGADGVFRVRTHTGLLICR
jgi:cyclopropane fatty-acyl-phospholipid synthase-like methyltransferase